MPIKKKMKIYRNVKEIGFWYTRNFNNQISVSKQLTYKKIIEERGESIANKKIALQSIMDSIEIDKKIIKNTQCMLHQGTSNIDSNQSEIVSDSVPHVEVEKKSNLLTNI
jgi:hypothetical protein